MAGQLYGCQDRFGHLILRAANQAVVLSAKISQSAQLNHFKDKEGKCRKEAEGKEQQILLLHSNVDAHTHPGSQSYQRESLDTEFKTAFRQSSFIINQLWRERIRLHSSENERKRRGVRQRRMKPIQTLSLDLTEFNTTKGEKLDAKEISFCTMPAASRKTLPPGVLQKVQSRFWSSPLQLLLFILVSLDSQPIRN